MRRRLLALSSVLLVVSAVTEGQAGSGRAPALAARTPGAWPRLRMPDPIAHWMARKALDDAWELLGEPRCGSVLDGFSDHAGRSLDERLRPLSPDFQSYLGLVVFIDGSRELPCRSGVVAFTAPGSRVVRLCGHELKRVAKKDAHDSRGPLHPRGAPHPGPRRGSAVVRGDHPARSGTLSSTHDPARGHRPAANPRARASTSHPAAGGVRGQSRVSAGPRPSLAAVPDLQAAVPATGRQRASSTAPPRGSGASAGLVHRSQRDHGP